MGLTHPQGIAGAVKFRDKSLTPEGVADSIRGDNTRFVTAQDAKAELGFFFNLLHTRQPALIGGKLPPDGFYYGAR